MGRELPDNVNLPPIWPPRVWKSGGGGKKPPKGKSGNPPGAMMVAAIAFASLPFGVIIGIALYLLHGYGVI